MYNEFAYFYDQLNGAANYRRLHRYIRRSLRRFGVKKGIIADLGCGTGLLTRALAGDGYDLLALDLSHDMLEVLAERLAQQPRLQARVQLLCQDITRMELFGTVQAAVSTFDTLNHIGPYPRLQKAIFQVAFFMDEGAVFIFDMNTPYKYQTLLRDQSYQVEAPDASCIWTSRYDEAVLSTHITVETTRSCTGESYREEFDEYCYTREQVEQALSGVGLQILEVRDGDTFRDLKDTSQRMIFVAKKLYTQLQKI